jgi:hypothetical protein
MNRLPEPPPETANTTGVVALEITPVPTPRAPDAWR